MEPEKTKKRWERTNTENLLKLAATGGYYARVKVNGKERWKSLKTKLFSVAKLRLAGFERMERQRANGPNAAIEMDDHSGGAFLDLYLSGVGLKGIRQSSIERIKTAALALEKTWPEFRSLGIRNITALQCKKWDLDARKYGTGFIAPRVAKKSKPMSSSAFNKTLSLLRETLALAVNNGVISTNPALEVERMPPKKKELVLPTQDQFHAILNNIRKASSRFSKQSADMVAFLAYSGARISECRAATWQDIDEKRNMTRIHGTKTTSSDRWIPLFPNLKNLLKTMEKGRLTASTKVIASTRKSSSPAKDKIFRTRECGDALANACKKVGIPKMTHHDLRHLFATRCIEAGVDIPTVSRWLGHVDGGALAMSTYGHLRQDHSQAQAAKITW